MNSSDGKPIILDRLLRWYNWLLASGRGLFLFHELTRKEFDQLFPLAWNLADSILHSDVGATIIAHDALDRLPQAMAQQRKRLEHDAKGPRRTLILDRRLTVQRLVIERTRFGEIGFTPNDLALYYVKHLINDCLSNTSFYAAIAINVFIYNLPLREALRFYSFLINDPTDPQKRQSAASEKKRLIIASLKERFGELLREDQLTQGELLFIYQDPAGLNSSTLEEQLRRLAPWGASCRLPEGFIQGQIISDLHGDRPSTRVRSTSEDPQLEINRVYALTHPEIYQALCKVWKFNPQLRIPRFYIR